MRELNRELNNCYLTIFVMASMIVTLIIMLTEANDTIIDQKTEIEIIKTRQEFDNNVKHFILTKYNGGKYDADHAGVRF